MSSNCYNLYAISFTVSSESGLALVAAPDERTAFQVLKSSGSRSAVESGYTLVEIRNLGMTSSCEFGLLMESYVNALEAYNAIVDATNKLKGETGPQGEKGDTGDKGEKGEKGDKGDKGDRGEGVEALGIVIFKPGEFTYRDVDEAVAAGKAVFLQDETVLIPCVGQDDDDNYLFSLQTSERCYEFTKYTDDTEGGVHINTPFTINTSKTVNLTPNSAEDVRLGIELHKVSKTGSYTDLRNKPDIPSVFVAVYGETTYEEIDRVFSDQAATAILCVRWTADGWTCRPLRYWNDDDERFEFVNTVGSYTSLWYVDSTDTWDEELTTLPDYYVKPINGIPASDLADGVIPDVSGFVTKSVNDLTNYYLKSETYTRAEVQALIGAISQFHYEIAASTSAVSSPANNVLYLIGPTGSGADKYEEYVYPNSTQGWVKIGDTSIDLSGLVTTQALNQALASYATVASLATVATSGSYNDLSNKPTIPDVTGKADKVSNATSGNFAGLDSNGNPTDSGSKASDFATAAQGAKADTAVQPEAGKGLFSGSYNDLTDKPTIPTTYAGSPSAGGPATKALAIPFGNVDAGSTNTVITATVDNFPDTLVDGVCAYIRNDVVASASGWTLNINGTGAKPVYASNADATRTTTIFSAAVTYLFIYNSSRVEGGCWDMYYGYNANDNTIGYNLRTNAMSLPVTSVCYRYRLLFTSADGTKFVPANASSSTNATSTRTTTQTPIDPFGSIRYYGYTTEVSSGSRPGVAYLWEQYSVTLGYSFNRTGAALTLTAWEPVYIKCAPQSDGSAIIEAETPYTQTLPTTADGFIYIFLGVAVSATSVEMVFHHPVYYYADGAIRLWTNEQIQDTSNFVQKSNTAGLLKNDGTVDTTSYGTYSKPSGGIPASDLASGVIPSVPVTNVTVGGVSVLSNGTAVVPAIPTVPTISTDIAADKASTDKTAAPSAVYAEVHPAPGSAQPAGGMLPNVFYNLGTLSGDTTFVFATAPDANIVNEWMFQFTTPSTAPTITWPAAITGWSGGSAPTIAASKTYQVSVLNGLGVIAEF